MGQGREDLCVHEGKHLSADGEGKGDDEEHEERHLCYEQEEDLRYKLSVQASMWGLPVCKPVGSP